MADETHTFPEGFEDPIANPDIPWVVAEDPASPDPVPPQERLDVEAGWDVEVADRGQQALLHPALAEHPEHVDQAPSKRGRVAPAVAGISLTDYSRTPDQKGWGPACGGGHATVQLSQARVTVRSEIAELVGLIMRANEAQGYHYRPADTGAYNCRKIAGTTVWSNHAWALAIDANWQTNPMRRPLTTDRPRWELDRWNRYGFAWGGDYTGSTPPDTMHEEFMGTPAQAVAATALARQELGGGVTPTPTPVPAPPSGDAEVRQDQFNLNDTGFPCAVDGVWGPASIQACKNFQYAAHLSADGICGPATRAALKKVPSWHGDPGNGTGGYPISQWQQKLKDHGWHIEVDNVWGAHSQSIMRQYQTEKGLAVTGGGTPQTWTSLYCTVN